jgi:hypothetical protein
MTPFEMEEQIKNLNQWASEVAQYLPLLATKDDLKAFATREDLKPFATKQDLAQAVAKLATKQELADAVAKLATKQELADAVAKLATKGELKAGLEDAKGYTEHLILVTRQEIRQVDDKVTAMAVDVRQIAQQVAILTARNRKKGS